MSSFTVATVIRWTGRETRALRLAKRMSIETFAGHLGITGRTVSKWEAGQESIVPRPVNQEALDTSLLRSPPDVQERFTALIGGGDAGVANGNGISPVAPVNTEYLCHPTDGKLMTYVEAGHFQAGPDNERLWLPGYWIDVYPTTNADYARFIDATGHPPPRHWSSGRCPAGRDRHPVVWITWRDANEYAAWAGKELPSAHQWEKCARGPHGAIYPWGNAPTAAKCNLRESGIGSTTPVDRYHSGVSVYGAYDMCGNIWEWLETESDPGRHELKGSAFTSPFRRAAPASFNDASADMADDDTGFRCVSTAPLGLMSTISHSD